MYLCRSVYIIETKISTIDRILFARYMFPIKLFITSLSQETYVIYSVGKINAVWSLRESVNLCEVRIMILAYIAKIRGQ